MKLWMTTKRTWLHHAWDAHNANAKLLLHNFWLFLLVWLERWWQTLYVRCDHHVYYFYTSAWFVYNGDLLSLPFNKIGWRTLNKERKGNAKFVYFGKLHNIKPIMYAVDNKFDFDKIWQIQMFQIIISKFNLSIS